MAEKRRKCTRNESCIRHVFSGTLVHSTSESMMDICQKRVIGVDDDGKVTDLSYFSSLKFSDLPLWILVQSAVV